MRLIVSPAMAHLAQFALLPIAIGTVCAVSIPTIKSNKSILFPSDHEPQLDCLTPDPLDEYTEVQFEFSDTGKLGYDPELNEQPPIKYSSQLLGSGIRVLNRSSIIATRLDHSLLGVSCCINSTCSKPIHQIPMVGQAKFSVEPSSIEIGQQFNVSCAVYVGREWLSPDIYHPCVSNLNFNVTITKDQVTIAHFTQGPNNITYWKVSKMPGIEVSRILPPDEDHCQHRAVLQATSNEAAGNFGCEIQLPLYDGSVRTLRALKVPTEEIQQIQKQIEQKHESEVWWTNNSD